MALAPLLTQPSLLRRVFLASLLVFVLTRVAVYLYSVWNLMHGTGGEFEEFMRSSVRTLQAQMVNPDAGATPESRFRATAGIFDAMVVQGPSQLEGMVLQLRLADGTLLASSPSDKGRGIPPAPRGRFQAIVDGRPAQGYAELSPDGRYIVLDTLPVETLHTLALDQITEWGNLIPFLVAFPFVLVPMGIAVYTGLRPVRRLSAELAARPAGDLSPVRSRHVYAELAPLVAALNSNLARTRGLIERERTFLADAAHELRTPLAVVTAQADILVRATDPGGRDLAAAQLRAGLKRMSRLVSQLLALARLDSGVDAVAQSDVAPVDAVAILREAVAAHAPQAQSRDMDLSYFGPDRCELQAAGPVLYSIADNLVANAVRYGREGGRIVVALRTDARQTEFEVADDGPGIPATQWDRIFERFHRVDGGTAAASGSGLGLAIVRAAADSLGAEVTVSEGLDGSGVRFTVRFKPQRHDA